MIEDLNWAVQRAERSLSALQRARTLFNLLNEDVARAYPTLDDVQGWFDVHSAVQSQSRQYVRAAYAFFEGIAASLQQHSLDGTVELPPEDHAFITGIRHEPDDKGRLRPRPILTHFLPNVRYAFDVFARAHGLALRPEYTSAGFQSFSRGVKVRDRLVHPKSIDDLKLEINELQDNADAVAWFVAQHNSLMIPAMAEHQAQLVDLAAKFG